MGSWEDVEVAKAAEAKAEASKAANPNDAGLVVDLQCVRSVNLSVSLPLV